MKERARGSISRDNYEVEEELRFRISLSRSLGFILRSQITSKVFSLMYRVSESLLLRLPEHDFKMLRLSQMVVELFSLSPQFHLSRGRR